MPSSRTWPLGRLLAGDGGGRIDADESIVGSIGVISAAFGVHRLIERWGIERRLYTQGEHKSMLDPFRPEDHPRTWSG